MKRERERKYIYIYIYVYIYIYIHICICIYIYIYIYIHTHIILGDGARALLENAVNNDNNKWVYIYIYIYTYNMMCIYTYIYVYMLLLYSSAHVLLPIGWRVIDHALVCLRGSGDSSALLLQNPVPRRDIGRVTESRFTMLRNIT